MRSERRSGGERVTNVRKILRDLGGWRRLRYMLDWSGMVPVDLFPSRARRATKNSKVVVLRICRIKRAFGLLILSLVPEQATNNGDIRGNVDVSCK